jgi:hypothetical protein
MHLPSQRVCGGFFVWGLGYAGASLKNSCQAMEPVEWGLLAIAALMAKKSLETTSDTVTHPIDYAIVYN